MKNQYVAILRAALIMSLLIGAIVPEFAIADVRESEQLEIQIALKSNLKLKLRALKSKQKHRIQLLKASKNATGRDRLVFRGGTFDDLIIPTMEKETTLISIL